MTVDRLDDKRFNLTSQVVKEIHVDELTGEAQDLINKMATMKERLSEINDILNQASMAGVLVDQDKAEVISIAVSEKI